MALFSSRAGQGDGTVITVAPPPAIPPGGTQPPAGTPILVTRPPIPNWRWGFRYAFGIALIALAGVLVYFTVFEVDDSSQEGTRATTFDRTFTKPEGANKPRISHQVKTVTDKPSTEGGRLEWLGAGLLGAALFLALGGAFVDRDRLSFKLGKDLGLDVGGGPDQQTTTSAALKETPSGAPPKQAAEIAVRTDQINKDGVPVQAAASMAAEAHEQGVPPAPAVKKIVDATAAKAEEQNLDFSAGQLALSAVKAFDAHSEHGVDPKEAAARALDEVAELSK